MEQDAYADRGAIVVQGGRDAFNIVLNDHKSSASWLNTVVAVIAIITVQLILFNVQHNDNDMIDKKIDRLFGCDEKHLSTSSILPDHDLLMMMDGLVTVIHEVPQGH